MAKPYSLDLRERVVARVLKGESIRMVAEALSISAPSVSRWSSQFRKIGHAKAGKMGGHVKPILAAHRDWILERIAGESDVTLRELQAELAERGVVVCYGTVWSFVHDAGLSFKKACCPAIEIGRTWSATARVGKSIKPTLIRCAWSSLMKPGRRRTWLRCGAGSHKGGG